MPRVAKRKQLIESLLQEMFEKELPPGVAVRKFDELMETALSAALLYWFQTKLPLHFKRQANTLYSYAPRHHGYLIAKYTGRPVFGRPSKFTPVPKLAAYAIAGSGKDPNPIVFSGRTQTQVTSAPAGLRVRRTRNGYIGELVLSVPSHIFQNRHIDLISELKRYNAQDLAEMYDIVSRIVSLGLYGIEIPAIDVTLKATA